MDDTGRLTRLEERYAHLQRHQVEQDRVILELGKEVAELKKELDKLRTRAAGEPESGALPYEKPPHY